MEKTNNKKAHICTYQEAFGGTYLNNQGLEELEKFTCFSSPSTNTSDSSDTNNLSSIKEEEDESPYKNCSNFEQYSEEIWSITDKEFDSYIPKIDSYTYTGEDPVHKGLRFNSGKLRYDLLHPKALEGITKVLTKGAEKYAPRNWELGMEWTSVIQSLERHLAAFKAGEDYDPETGQLHVDHIQCNAHFLSAYYHIYPKGDDRDLWFKKPLKRLYLDIDGVLADFEKHFLTYLDLPMNHPTDWNDYRFRENFKMIEKDNAFWVSIPRLFDPAEFDYPIAGYVTARPIGNEITNRWLQNYGFPKGDLVNVGSNGSKVEFLKEKCDIFVDDSIYNFMELQRVGVTCFLMSRPHNKKYDVGYFRVQDIKELLKRIKSL